MTSAPTVNRPRTPRAPARDRQRRPRDRQRRPRGRHRVRTWLLVSLAVALVVAAGWLIGFSPVFTTRSVAVSGARILTGDGVRQAAAVRLGRPLARQDLDAIARRVAALPAVQSVHVGRRWPSTVVVQLVERTPVLAVPHAGEYLLVDRSGVAFERASSVDGVVVAAVDPTNTARLADAATVVAALPPGLRERVSSVAAPTADGIRLALRSGPEITWGTAEESPLKASVALALLKQKPRAIDVSTPHNPAVR